MDRIIAVVVTYNRQQLLSQCISALKNQTRKIDKILVVNNGSTDGTEHWLQQQNDIDFISQENSGSGGGFYTGIKTAFKSGYSWIWLMDDDGYPKNDALEKLLEDDNEELCMRNCAVLNKEDKKTFVWKTKHYKTIDEVSSKKISNISHLFNGTLLHRKIVERVGLPKAPLFLWGDETEYFYRIVRKNAIPFYTQADSILYHPATSFTYKNDWNYTKDWKMYYYVRNRFAVHKSKFYQSLPLAIFLYIGFLIVFAGTTLIFQKTNRMKKLLFIFWPAIDALKNNFSITPSLVLERLNKRKTHFDFITNPQTIESLFPAPPRANATLPK